MSHAVNVLLWDNIDSRLLNAHQKVMEYVGLDCRYTIKNVAHGDWMDSVLREQRADFYTFLDIDCVPLSRAAIARTLEYVAHDYLVGNAQVTNCTVAKHEIYCAPSFLSFSRETYENLGRPSCRPTRDADVAQLLTRRSVRRQRRIKMFYPTAFQGVARRGIWRLSGYGYYGLGTIYDDVSYHMFQSRDPVWLSRFEVAVECILNGRPQDIQRTYDARHEHMGSLAIEDNY